MKFQCESTEIKGISIDLDATPGSWKECLIHVVCVYMRHSVHISLQIYPLYTTHKYMNAALIGLLKDYQASK